MVRVVFIEDRSLMLDAFRSAVDWNAKGCQPIGFFASCDEALPFIMQEKPDVVVSDIVMHGMDGLELSRVLYESDLDVKVIIVSAYSSFDYAQKALKAGVFDYFEKPLNFDALVDSILRAGAENASLRQMRAFVLQHRAIYQERFLIKLMLGVLTDREQIRSDSEFLMLDHLDTMRCAAFRLVSRRARASDAGQTMNREVELLQLAEQLKDKIGRNSVYGPYSVQNDETLFILTGETVKDDKQFTALLTELVGQFSNAGLSAIQAGIGCSVDVLTRLNLSFETASRALDACFVFGESCVVHYGDLPGEANGYWMLFSQLENQILHAINIQDAVAVETAVERFREQADQLYLSGEALKATMKSIACKAESLYITTDRRLHTLLGRIDRSESMDGMLRELSAYCVRVCGEVRNTRIMQNQNIAQTAKRYIDDHFASDQVTVNTVAEFVSVTPNYLSSVFKREYGQGIHEYITAQRIDKARELLIHTNKSIGTIGIEVGYPNPYHFSMTFRKATELTPTEYRRKNRVE